MKWLILICLGMCIMSVNAVQGAEINKSAEQKDSAKWDMQTVPWDSWFKDNALVTDKDEYVHFFWNAQDYKSSFEVSDKKSRLVDAAMQLVNKLYPDDASADLVKVDIVYVATRDNYGKPQWDSLQRIAHLEFLRSKVKSFIDQNTHSSSSAGAVELMNKLELF